MKELRIHVKIINDQVATAMQRKGFDNSSSANLEILGILQNLIRIEQDKMHTQTKIKVPPKFSKDETQVFDLDDESEESNKNLREERDSDKK